METPKPLKECKCGITYEGKCCPGCGDKNEKKQYIIKIWFEKESKLYVITAEKNGKELVVTQGETFIESFKMLGEAIYLMEDYKDEDHLQLLCRNSHRSLHRSKG